MTQDEIRKLLGGYATNTLSADERRSLFEAALEDQELFNTLQNEDALRELLDDAELRDQVRLALAAPATPKMGFSWRRWAFGVALPAVVAVGVILVMNRPKAPEPIPQPIQTARVEPPQAAAAPQSAPPPVAKKAAPAALASAQRADAQAPVARSFRAGAARPVIPDAVRQQFSAGFATNDSFYQGPLVRYSVVRSGPEGHAVRVEVSTAIAGYLALYRVDKAGSLQRVYPTNDMAMQVLPNLTLQIPMEPVKVEVGEKLRLVVVPAAAPASIGALGGALNGTANDAKVRAPTVPLVVDIPLGP